MRMGILLEKKKARRAKEATSLQVLFPPSLNCKLEMGILKKGKQDEHTQLKTGMLSFLYIGIL